MFLSCRPFVAITTLTTGLVGVEVTSVSWLGQLTVGVLVLNFKYLFSSRSYCLFTVSVLRIPRLKKNIYFKKLYSSIWTEQNKYLQQYNSAL